MQQIGLAGLMELYNFIAAVVRVTDVTSASGLADGLGGVWEFDDMPNGQRFRELVTQLPDALVRAGLPVSAELLRSVSGGVNERASIESVVNRCRSFVDGSIAEMSAKLFYMVEPAHQHYLVDAPQVLFGIDAPLRFPAATNELSEAGACLAFERWTASVFHSIRALEYGLSSVQRSLGIPQAKNLTQRSWGTTLREIGSEIEKRNEACRKTFDANWDARRTFYAGTHAHLSTAKTAWRDPTMHVESRPYLQGEAADIYSSTVGFMRHLSGHLDEQGNFTP